MTPEQLRNHIYKTYWWLRGGLCGLALAFPFLLLGVGWLYDVNLQDSMSEYYFAFDPHESPLRVFPVRVVFVGILFALGFSLMLYRGLSKTENWLLNIAGFFALVAALYPMQTPPWCTNCGINKFSYVHEVAGYVVFACLGIVALFCTKATLRKLPVDKRQWYRWFRVGYSVLGGLMIVGPAIAIGMARFLGIYDKRLFVVESILLGLFGLYWALRSFELWISQVEWNALTGKS
jgi:hypothetical protein